MLTAVEKREALEAIDWLVDYLFVPIEKNEWNEYTAVEEAFAQSLLKAWGDQVGAALEVVASTAESLPGKAKPEHVQLMMSVLASLLGEEMAAKVGEDVGKYLAAAYTIGKQGVARKLRMAVGTGLIDEAAVAVMKKHTLYWIGSHFDTELSQTIEALVRTTMIESGMGRAEAARYLKGALGDEFARSDAYWRGLAAVAANRSRNLGHVQGFVDAGVTVYEVVNPMDERTSPICRKMNGVRFPVSAAVKHRDAIMAAQSPEEIKQIAPWRRVKQDPKGGPGDLLVMDGGKWVKFQWSPRTMAQKGLSLPPYHFHCRTTVVAVEFDTAGTGAIPVPVSFKPLPNPKDIFPPVNQLKLVGPGKHLGGAGEKWIYRDTKGRQYIFKPAVAKGTDKVEPFRAHVQEAVAKVQAKVLGEEFAVPIRTVELQGKVGTIQPLLSDVTGDLTGIPVTALSPDQLRMIQREHVVDWVVGNFDSHPGNHLLLSNGRVVGIDKEQAFRYIGDAKSWRVSTAYHPNAVYGEKPPIGNTLYSLFGQNQLELNPQDVLPVIQRLEAIPDEEYREIFRAYAEALHGKGAKAEALLDQIVKRKNVARKEFEAFFSEILTQRTGKKVTFKFADAIAAADLPAQAQVVQAFSAETLEQLTWKELFDLAKPHKPKYAQSWTKQEFIEFLADHTRKEVIEEQVRQRIQSRRAGSRARARVFRNDAERWAFESEVFEDLSRLREVRRSPFGVGFQRDFDAVEGQVITVREAVGDGVQGYMVEFKLTRARAEQFREVLLDEGARWEPWVYYENGANYSQGRFELRNPLRDVINGGERGALVWQTEGVKVEFWASQSLEAMRGSVRIIVDGDGPTAARRMRAALERLGLREVVEAPTEEASRYFGLRRLLWQHEPLADRRIVSGEWKPSLAELEEYLKRRGVKTDGLVWEEVFPGYSTYVDRSIDWEKEHGVAYLWAGFGSNDPTNVVRVIRSGRYGGGMMSSKARFDNGIMKEGASTAADYRVGGADSVFTRMVTKELVGKGPEYAKHYRGKGIRVHFSPEVLQRTDWYAHKHDSYGAVMGVAWEDRLGAVDFVRSQKRRYTMDNEVMIRRGIPNRYMTEITTDSEGIRQAVLNALRKEKITEINGVPIEEFVKVRTKI